MFRFLRCFSLVLVMRTVSDAFVPLYSSKLHQNSIHLQVHEENTASSFVKVCGVREIANDYDLFLLDMWGVMHDGSKPYDGVLDVVKKLKDAGKRLVILSNSSKRQNSSIKMLRKLGFDPEDFEQIITSGELSHQMLLGKSQCEPWEELEQVASPEKRKVFVFGSGDGDAEYCQTGGWQLAKMEEASLIIARGTFTINDGSTVTSKREDADQYEAVLTEKLQHAARRRIPMLVTNPDKVRPDEGLPPMPGRIGDQYERALGGGKLAETLVKRVGKPFRDVYDVAMKHCKDSSRVCMIGDALETDVTGGNAVGIATVWVLKDGIHSPDLSESEPLGHCASKIVDTFNKLDGTYAKGRVISPSIIMPHFRW